VRMSEALEQHQNEQRLSQVRGAISEFSSQIYKETNGLEAGNPQGDVTIVEFSDYNCPYCKRAFTHLTNLIEKDKNVRVVLKEFPIFGERS
ncbi:MAG: thioredoxin domain-containing protein, partial [Burkholderiales bacterium]|nr:thioredoxin domain-containing protein [Burkholderiales bacterium]